MSIMSRTDKEIPNKGSTQGTNPARQNGGGVADYFAILGVGDTLELKSTQKKYQRASNNTIDESERIRQKEVIMQEEECAMAERFYREIVEVALFTAYSDENGVYVTRSLATSANAEKDDVIFDQDESYDKNRYENSQGRRCNTSSIIPSPTKLLRKSIDRDEHQIDNDDTNKALPSEILGFQIIYQTAKVKKASLQDIHPTIGQNLSNVSYGTDHDNSINTSTIPLNNTLDTLDLATNQSLDADLNPTTGLFTILNNGGRIAQDLSFTNVSFDSQPDQQENWRRLKLKRGIQQRLHEQISPILLTTEKAAVSEYKSKRLCKQFYIGYRRRGADETNKSAVADIILMYCKVHKTTIISPNNNTVHATQNPSESTTNIASQIDGDDALEDTDSSRLGPKTVAVLRRGFVSGAGLAKRMATSGKNRIMRGHSIDEVQNNVHDDQEEVDDDDTEFVEERLDPLFVEEENDSYNTMSMHELLGLPQGFENGEWIIPCAYQSIKLPVSLRERAKLSSPFGSEGVLYEQSGSDTYGITHDKRTNNPFLFDHQSGPTYVKGDGIEKDFLHNDSQIGDSNILEKGGRRNPWSPAVCAPMTSDGELTNAEFDDKIYQDQIHQREKMMPSIMSQNDMSSLQQQKAIDDDVYEYVPIIAVRRQRAGEEERFHEDPGIVDIEISLSQNSIVAFPGDDDGEDDEFEENEDDDDDISGKPPWTTSKLLHPAENDPHECEENAVLHPLLVFRRNRPRGFIDTPFATSVLDRFPKKDYKGVPLPQEELPMFCYPTGCRLFRARNLDAPLAEYYGFVVKNERGDNIHVSCVSFVEPLEASKLNQLDRMSENLRKFSLPHKRFCEQREAMISGRGHINDDKSSFLLGFDEEDRGEKRSIKSDMILTGFDELMTFELKTICLVSRYPFWSAFRRFLAHLHILSGSSSDLPLERYISHLLLSVPLPKPGGQCILLPLPAVASPCVLHLPPAKDLPLLDLPCHRLFSCLDVPTIVTIVLGFLALERKVIVMSSYPSLVSDVCEILRSLLFPFELCAPYVPRLTMPFMSCLQFPGAIFVGIHDDGIEGGLAANVRKEIPEDSFIVDLDTGDIDTNIKNGDRYEALKECWDIIPAELRSLLVEEVETLCQDARIVPGREPLGIEIEAALDVSVTPTFGDAEDDILDDRAIRDSFLRFFCSILGGYERFLVLPDMDFLISGAEWFDTTGFLNSTKTQSRSPFLNTFVTTQLFQSFIQRRTEASDVRCLLFDECLAEFHSSKVPYGRLSRYMETSIQINGVKSYDLLVDQCAADIFESEIDGNEISSTEVSILTTHTSDGFIMINNSGDLVTAPSRKNLPLGMRYVYCIDGHPHFPQKLDTEMFFPKEPEKLSVVLDEESVPILTRSDHENDVSNLRRKMAIPQKGVKRQRRCLFQLPKVMGSHVLNAWLMCIPSQVSQKLRSSEQQQSYILRAFGVLKTLRSRYRIVPDEAGYRCLMVVCGRADSDRRHELVKLFGLLRSDGIFPSAVTLGQYTRAIAEGFSKRSFGKANSSIVNYAGLDDDFVEILDPFHPFDFLDGNITELEESGKRWRSTRDRKRKSHDDHLEGKKQMQYNAGNEISKNRDESQKKSRKRKQPSSWSPVCCSSSFSPHYKTSKPDESFDLMNDFHFVALWSRTTKCHSCSHILLDEEIQAGWDELSLENELSNEIKCPRCSELVLPLLGFIEMTTDNDHIQASNVSLSPKHMQNEDLQCESNTNLPPQLRNCFSSKEDNDGSCYVPYLNPSKMRKLLEDIVEENGEDTLERESLRHLSPVVFFNLWWFCARFNLPLPLTVTSKPSNQKEENSSNGICHSCAFVAWDKSLAIAGCRSGAKAVRSLQTLMRKSCRPKAAPSFQNLVKSFDVVSTDIGVHDEPPLSHSILSDDFPFLAYLNFQSLAQGDWDNGDLSAILVTLVEACDKRDFLPALKSVLQCNLNRRQRNDGYALECYRTLLYLTRYQCMSAFHKFFPATCKVCKGYHFWCPHTTVTIFDRMFRDAVDCLQVDGNMIPIFDVSDSALAFRSVFGHIV